MQIPLAKRVKVFPSSLQIPLRKCMKLIAFLARNCLQTPLAKGQGVAGQPLTLFIKGLRVVGSRLISGIFMAGKTRPGQLQMQEGSVF